MQWDVKYSLLHNLTLNIPIVLAESGMIWRQLCMTHKLNNWFDLTVFYVERSFQAWLRLLITTVCAYALSPPIFKTYFALFSPLTVSIWSCSLYSSCHPA